MNSSMQTNSPDPVRIIHVFTDVGVKDIDDELLIKYLSDQVCLDLTFVPHRLSLSLLLSTPCHSLCFSPHRLSLSL